MANTIIVDGRKVNATKGFDIIRRGQVVEHFDTIEEARTYVLAKGGTIRYFMAEEV